MKGFTSIVAIIFGLILSLGAIIVRIMWNLLACELGEVAAPCTRLRLDNGLFPMYFWLPLIIGISLIVTGLSSLRRR